MSASQCSLCPNNESFTLPERQINISSLGFVSDCLSLSSLVPLLFASNSSECELLHSVSSLCGCPTRDDACRLCSDGSTAVYGSRELQFLSDMFNGIVPTCELVEAMLTTYSLDDGFCSSTRLLLEEYCGCGADIGSDPVVYDEVSGCKLCEFGQVPNPNQLIEIDGFPFKTCGQLEMATQSLFAYESIYCATARILYIHCGCETTNLFPCPICGVTQSYEVPLPDKILDAILTGAFLPAIPISCNVLKDIALGYPNQDAAPDIGGVCAAIQGIATECGCPKQEELTSCRMCVDALKPEYYGYRPLILKGYDQITCRFVELISPFLKDNDRILYGDLGITLDCRFSKSIGYFCGCNDGVFTYWGANTISKQIAAQWIQRIAAILSFCGSLAILIRIFTIKRSTQSRLHFQIMFALSCADMLSSIAWGLGSLPTNYDFNSVFGIDLEVFGEKADEIRFYGSNGNDATCKIQGFVLQLGFMSILYNMSLSYYYKLCVVNSYREGQFNKYYKALLLGAPAVVGLIVALASIPYITFTPVGCTIGSYKDKGGWAKMMLLFYLPYGPAFLFIPFNTIYVFRSIRAQRKRGEKWSIAVGDKSSILTSTALPPNATKARSLIKVVMEWVGKRKPQYQRRNSTAIARLESQVFWQSLWYLVAFLASYSIFFFFFAVDGYQFDSYPFYVASSLLTPMQGFFNFLIFFRKAITHFLNNGKRWFARILKPFCIPFHQQVQSPCDPGQGNPESSSELVVHSDVKVAHLSRSDKGNAKSQASSHDLWLQPIEMLDEARRCHHKTKSYEESSNASVEKSDVNQDFQAGNVISLQLQNIEVIDDVLAISQRDDMDDKDPEEIINVLGDDIVYKARTNQGKDSEASSVTTIPKINRDKKEKKIEVKIQKFPPSGEESLEFSSVIEFVDSEIEGKGDEGGSFWSKAFGVSSKSMASYQRHPLPKKDDSSIQVEASKISVTSKGVESLPKEDFPMQKANQNSDLLTTPKVMDKKVNSWKSLTFSSVLEFDGDEHNNGKASDWWTKVFHR